MSASKSATKPSELSPFRHWRWVLVLFALGLVAVYLASGIYSVGPNERGIKFRFGQVVEDGIAPGIHYRLPWPIESVVLLEVTSIRSLEVELTPRGVAVGNPHLYAITGDVNLLEATVKIDYTIKQPAAFVTHTEDPEGLLGGISQHALVSALARRPVDEALTSGKHDLQTELKRIIQHQADRFGLGIHIAAVHLQRLDPPLEVALAFRDVASAREDRHKMVQQAQGERNKRIPDTRAAADALLQQAAAARSEAIARAKGESERFTATLHEISQVPQVGLARLYFDSVQRSLAKVRLQIIDPQAEQLRGPVP